MYKNYYKGQESKARRESGRDPTGPVKKYCWIMSTTVRFKDGRCMLEGCVHRLKEGCLQVMI